MRYQPRSGTKLNAFKLYRQRESKLRNATTPKATLGTADGLRAVPDRLRRIRTQPKLLAQHHESDRLLSLIEECAGQAVEALDEAIQ
jgi:hypothetical protein